jgi:RimJ/RimL family protein N-acetyltransferase
MTSYKILDNQIFSNGNLSLVPIRIEDRHKIMKWRNEQMYHLRQNQPLTNEAQDYYFENVIAKLFEQEQPNQLLFSYLENNVCIGYGGLVHINWEDKNAEISFVMETELEQDYFIYHWNSYLSIIEKIAFEEIGFHKIYTYAYDLRPKLFTALIKSGFIEEARLKEHCYFNERYLDILIHSKIN